MNTLSSLLYFIGTRINLDFYYPVGTYYETSKPQSEFDPNVAWGGTWVLDSQGKVTVSMNSSETEFDTLGETGGAKTVTLTDAQMAHGHSFTQPKTPNHTHSAGSGRAFVTHSSDSSKTINERTFQSGTSLKSLSIQDGDDWYSITATASSGGNVSCTGGAVANLSGASSTRTGHSNLQPYVVVNRWHRTA